jgi:uncharacterized RDD family membrane protein YckC
MTTPKKIALAAWIISAGGLLTECAAFINVPLKLTEAIVYLAHIVKTANLSLFGMNVLGFYNFETHLEANYLSMFFYFVMLIGSIAYVRSDQRETRVLRFSFSVILLCSAIYFIDGLLMFARGVDFSGASGFDWFVWTFYRAKSAALVYLSWWILKTFQQSRVLLTTEENEQVVLVKASRWRRLFNVAVDTFVCLFIFSAFSRIYGAELWQSIEDGMGRQVSLMILMIIFRLIYYPFFETLFGTTPAKFLSETRVVGFNGGTVSFGEAFGRTVSRFVPFEAFSFFGDEGWHDKWTNTTVVKEKREGISGGFYLLIFPVVAILGLGGYFGYEAYKDHQYRVRSRASHDQKVKALERELNNLSTDHYIQLRDLDSYSSETYLKVEEVDNDVVFASIFSIDDYNPSRGTIVSRYQQNEGAHNTVLIKRSDLMNAYTKEYNSNVKSSAKLLNDDKRYEIEMIFRRFVPVIEGSAGGSIHGEEITLYINNCGWSCKLTEIKNLGGTIQWMITTPQTVSGVDDTQYGCATLYLNGSGYRQNSDYEFEFTLEDLRGDKRRYRVEGVNLSFTIEEISG